MTGSFYLDWAILAVSLLNLILMLWLGLTVFLNAERRGGGIWLAAGGLLLGAIFFVSHSAILGHGLSPLTYGLEFWWRVGWIPVIALPLAWYVEMLWYSGFWSGNNHLSSRWIGKNRLQLAGLAAAFLLSLFMAVLLAFTNPLPSFSQLAQYQLNAVPSLFGIPVLILTYPVYALLCIGLSLEALLHQDSPAGVELDPARSRARRWLVAATFSMLAVSLMVGVAIFWILQNAHPGLFSNGVIITVGFFDLGIDILITLSVLLLGQSIVAYEAFTGKTLPRGGLAQYWRRAIILAAGYSLLVAWSVTIHLRPIYSLLLSACLVIVFYALLSWRSYAERERLMQNLRPFVASQNQYENILTGETLRIRTNEGGNQEATKPVESGIEPFYALCSDVLESRQACLLALGPLAPFFGQPLVYPQGAGQMIPSIEAIASRLKSPAEIGIPLDPLVFAGFNFAVSLWSERGLIGLLLLGEKQNGSRYTQEEVEIGRATGERLIDTRASTEMARRLLLLQRQRLAQSQVLDRRTRRILHDDVLPLVHTALLSLNHPKAAPDQGESETAALLSEIHHLLSDLLRSMPVQSLSSVAHTGLLNSLREIVQEEMAGSFDQVIWDLQPEAERQSAALPALAAEIIFFAAREAIRNAAHYGRGDDREKPLCLRIALEHRDGLLITIEDNGVGIQHGHLFDTSGKLHLEGKGGSEEYTSRVEPQITLSSVENTSGQGLIIHSTMMAVIGGTLRVESNPGAFTRVVLDLPRSAWSIVESQGD